MKQNKIQHSKRRMQVMLGLAALALAAVGSAEIRASVNGAMINFPDSQPMMSSSNRVMVPMRGVFEAMDAAVTWNSDQKSITATRGTDTVLLYQNSNSATVNGQTITFDAPVTMDGSRTMVPLRFLSESLGADVFWNSFDRIVEIRSPRPVLNDPIGTPMMRIPMGTVIPFSLNTKLTSNESKIGDTFSASLDTSNMADYQGLGSGATLEGHVDYVRARLGKDPGVLNMAFDQIVMKDGRKYVVRGTLIGLDDKSVEMKDGRWVAKPGTKSDTLTYVGIGAGGGVLVALLTKTNVFTDALIGGALGLLLSSLQKDPTEARDVSLEPGTKFGIRLTQDFTFQNTLRKR